MRLVGSWKFRSGILGVGADFGEGDFAFELGAFDGGEGDFGGGDGAVDAADFGAEAEDLIDEAVEGLGVAFVGFGGELEGRVLLLAGFLAGLLLFGEPAGEAALGADGGVAVFDHGEVGLGGGAFDAGGADFEHVVDDDNAALAHDFVELFGVAEGAVGAHLDGGHAVVGVADDDTGIKHAGFDGGGADGGLVDEPVADVGEVGHLKEHGAVGSLGFIKDPGFPGPPIVVDTDGDAGGGGFGEVWQIGLAVPAPGGGFGVGHVPGEDGVGVLHGGGGAAVVPDAEGDAGLIDRLLDEVHFREGLGERLFNVNGFAKLCAELNDGPAELFRGGEDDELNFRIGDGLSPVRADVPGAESGLEVLQGLGV